MRLVCRSSIGIRLRHIRVRNREELAGHKKFWFLELSATKVPKCKRIERPSKQKDFQKMLKNPEGQILNLVWPPIRKPVFKIHSIQFLKNTFQFLPEWWRWSQWEKLVEQFVDEKSHKLHPFCNYSRFIYLIFIICLFRKCKVEICKALFDSTKQSLDHIWHYIFLHL